MRFLPEFFGTRDPCVVARAGAALLTLVLLLAAAMPLGSAGEEATTPATPATLEAPPAPATVAASAVATSAPAADPAQVASAVARMRADPRINGERKVNRLRWRDGMLPDASADDSWLAGLFRWLTSLFGWAATGSRALVIVLMLAAVALLAIFVLRRWKRSVRNAAVRVAPASAVQAFDTRPESLPDDIGAAALALWNDGQQRAALVLLYRGLLSRLEHVHALPVPASATEGDCVALLRQRAAAPVRAYGVGVIRVWQKAAYAHVLPATEAFAELCAGFDAALAPAPGVGA